MTMEQRVEALRELCSCAEEATKLIQRILVLTNGTELLTLEQRERLHMAEACDTSSLYEEIKIVLDVLDKTTNN